VHRSPEFVQVYQQIPAPMHLSEVIGHLIWQQLDRRSTLASAPLPSQISLTRIAAVAIPAIESPPVDKTGGPESTTLEPIL
jgi:hypothetical protein